MSLVSALDAVLVDLEAVRDRSAALNPSDRDDYLRALATMKALPILRAIVSDLMLTPASTATLDDLLRPRPAARSNVVEIGPRPAPRLAPLCLVPLPSPFNNGAA